MELIVTVVSSLLLNAFDPTALEGKIIADCENKSYMEYIEYVDQLGKMRNRRLLRILSEAEISHGDYAVTVYVRILDDSEVISYCKSYPTGSAKWVYAFWGLGAHPKKVVIGYIRQICASQGASERRICYSLCLKKGWSDLRAFAICDLNNKTQTEVIGWTLGTFAKQYLDSLPSP